MKLLLDTNIYLDFYRTNFETVDLFKSIIKNYKKLILTDQIIEEFDRNREVVLQNIKSVFEKESKIQDISSSFLKSVPAFTELAEIQRTYKVKRAIVSDVITSFIKDESKDPVASLFKELVNVSKKKDLILYSNEEIIRRAETRKRKGNPPTSSKYSIGDEINWEIILSNVTDDIVIVGRDATYRDNLSFLRKDFHKSTGKIIHTLTDKISDGLQLVGIKTKPKIVENEIAAVKQLQVFSDYWQGGK